MNRQIESLPNSLKGAYQEIEDVTDFCIFSLLGGPSPQGRGALSVMRVQTGCTVDNQGSSDFETFLGDLYPVLKEKWCQWLVMTYGE